MSSEEISTLKIFKVVVSCFPASEYGDSFTLVSPDEESALKLVANHYAKTSYTEEGDSCGRDRYETLHEWWKNPYKNRSGSTTGVYIDVVIEDIKEITSSVMISSDMT